MNMTTLVLLLESKLLTPLPSQCRIHLFVIRSFSLPFDIVLNVYLDSNLQLWCDIDTFA